MYKFQAYSRLKILIWSFLESNICSYFQHFSKYFYYLKSNLVTFFSESYVSFFKFWTKMFCFLIWGKPRPSDSSQTVLSNPWKFYKGIPLTSRVIFKYDTKKKKIYIYIGAHTFLCLAELFLVFMTCVLILLHKWRDL